MSDTSPSSPPVVGNTGSESSRESLQKPERVNWLADYWVGHGWFKPVERGRLADDTERDV